MAKSRSNAATQTQQGEQSHRLGLTIDAQTHLLIGTAAALRDCTPAELLSDAAWAIVGNWPVREREAVLSVVRARFGRLKRSCGASVAESASVVEEGRGSATTGSDVLAGRLADIQARTVDQPISDALSSLYGN